MAQPNSIAAFEQGVQAQAEGKTLGDNPYPRGSLNGEMWVNGFREAAGEGDDADEADQDDT